MRCYRRLLGISYRDHITNQEVLKRIETACDNTERLMTIIKRRKLKWYGHITRSGGLAKTCLQGTVRGARGRGRPKKSWHDNIKDWTGLGLKDGNSAALDRSRWKGIVASSTVPQRPLGLRD